MQHTGNYILLDYKDVPNVVANIASGVCTISDGNVTLSYPVATADAKNECAFYQEFATAFSDGEFSSFLFTKATVQELTGINTEGSSAAFLYKMASEHNELLTKVLKRLV